MITVTLTIEQDDRPTFSTEIAIDDNNSNQERIITIIGMHLPLYWAAMNADNSETFNKMADKLNQSIDTVTDAIKKNPVPTN